MKRATRNAAKTKQIIIEKSAPIFNVHGYAGTKMQMLIEATGYQMGGIYRHFETKMDLGKAVFQYSYETLVKRNLVVEDTLNAQEKLLTIIENYKEMILKPAIPGGCPLLNTAIEVDDTNAEFSQLAKSYVKEILNTIRQIIEEGKVSGHIKSDIDAPKEAQYLLASFEGAIMIGKLLKHPQPVLDIFNRAVAYLRACVFLSKG